MTDLLDAPAPRVDDAEDVDEAVPAAGDEDGLSPGARWLVAACLAGAAVIHAAMVPAHLGESAVEGWGFVISVWAQILLAVLVVVRPSRGVRIGVVAVNAALVAVWAVSRLVGLPFGANAGHAESVTVVDGVCVALEVVAVVVVAGTLAWRPTRWLARVGAPAAIAGAAGAVLLASAAVASPSARNHAAHEHADGAAPAAGGHDHQAKLDALGFTALANGHQHAHGQDAPLTAEERVTLARQLAATTPLIERYPTLGAAEAAGWHRSGPFSPGLGTHYQGPTFVPNSDGKMDPADLAAPMLIFDGLTPDAPLAGFMYLAYGTRGEPAGFAGPNDHWHYHEKICIVAHPGGGIDTPFGADAEGVTADMCTKVGGTFLPFSGYMVHVWNVPGYESPDGMFSELNPKITCPDGSYHTIKTIDIGNRSSTCLHP